MYFCGTGKICYVKVLDYCMQLECNYAEHAVVTTGQSHDWIGLVLYNSHACACGQDQPLTKNQQPGHISIHQIHL